MLQNHGSIGRFLPQVCTIFSEKETVGQEKNRHERNRTNASHLVAGNRGAIHGAGCATTTPHACCFPIVERWAGYLDNQWCACYQAVESGKWQKEKHWTRRESNQRLPTDAPVRRQDAPSSVQPLHHMPLFLMGTISLFGSMYLIWSGKMKWCLRHKCVASRIDKVLEPWVVKPEVVL